MKIMIMDKLVRHNLTLFKHLIHRQAEKTERYFQVARKAYQAFINIHTGELRFADLEKKFAASSDWLPIVIQLRPDDEGAFEVLQSEKESSFDCSKLEPRAYALLTKTIHILNQLSFDPKQGKNPFWILRHVAHIDFLLSAEEEGERNLIHNAWHSCNRQEAEYLLRDMAPGTYLFRKDEYASLLEDSINESRAKPVTCLTLTFRDWGEKICDKTLIYCEEKWMFYNDDLKLRGTRYESVKELLSTLGERLIRPLLAA